MFYIYNLYNISSILLSKKQIKISKGIFFFHEYQTDQSITISNDLNLVKCCNNESLQNNLLFNTTVKNIPTLSLIVQTIFKAQYENSILIPSHLLSKA